MADITAKLVNELRNKTGLGMMECKKALTETGGDVEKAVEYFRKKGVKTSITERAATEGRVTALVSPDRKRGVLVEINCNTDFTAKSDPVAKIAQAAAERLMANPSAKLADDAGIKTELVNVSQQTGENVQLGRSASLSTTAGTIGSYLYTVAGKGKIGVLVSIIGPVDEDLVRNLSMHIVAARPLAHTREELSAELIAKEKEIAIEQAKSSGKPQNIAEKIAEGKMNSFYAEKVLLDQEFINAEVHKGSVTSLLKAKGATLEKYVRLEVGQQ
ncbi:MAG: translation elongation factor Ts [Planctomycetota bacterium]|nr:translation elongation factor Ts [Planctomycetota bacterium]